MARAEPVDGATEVRRDVDRRRIDDARQAEERARVLIYRDLIYRDLGDEVFPASLPIDGVPHVVVEQPALGRNRNPALPGSRDQELLATSNGESGFHRSLGQRSG